jgi:hypothetical protein
MSLQSVLPLQVQVPWPALPDWQLKLRAFSLPANGTIAAKMAENVNPIIRMTNLFGL